MLIVGKDDKEKGAGFRVQENPDHGNLKPQPLNLNP
jgi:hypothetical protein